MGKLQFDGFSLQPDIRYVVCLKLAYGPLKFREYVLVHDNITSRPDFSSRPRNDRSPSPDFRSKGSRSRPNTDLRPRQVVDRPFPVRDCTSGPFPGSRETVDAYEYFRDCCVRTGKAGNISFVPWIWHLQRSVTFPRHYFQGFPVFGEVHNPSWSIGVEQGN